MDQLLPIIPGLLGVNETTFYSTLVVLVTVCNLIGRSIPDSAVGPLGVVRKICKIVGLYVGNRLSPTVTATDVGRAIVTTIPDRIIKDASNSFPEAVSTGVAAGNLADSILDAAAGRTAGRPYVAGESPEAGSVVPDQYRTDGPFAKGAAALTDSEK